MEQIWVENGYIFIRKVENISIGNKQVTVVALTKLFVVDEQSDSESDSDSDVPDLITESESEDSGVEQ